MTLPTLGRGDVLRRAILRIFWDGEKNASVEATLGDFFGASFAKPRAFVSDRLIIAGGGYLCRFEMPFDHEAIIDVGNDSTKTIRDLFYQIGYYEEPERSEPEPTFHAQYSRTNRTPSPEPVMLLDARGKGRLAGLKVDLQNRSWWLRPPWREIPLPRGFGLGLLEGWETITVDGGRVLRGTGVEDYFNGGFYFGRGPFSTPTHGCMRRSILTSRVSAYRFHVDDPVDFETSLTMTIDHGLTNSMNGDYTSVAYWYQHEPHDPFPPLPPLKDRRCGFPWINVAQWVLVVTLLGSIFGGLAWLLRLVLLFRD
jgi:hypothetical protein